MQFPYIVASAEAMANVDAIFDLYIPNVLHFGEIAP